MGSSNSITTKAGTVYEHLEYFPYGETWVHNLMAKAESLPFKFTGKEYDPETGWFYFGARYYDARLSRWTAVDPALDKYFPNPNDFDTEHDYFWYLEQDASGKLPGIGGVFNYGNLSLYTYALNNPVKHTDPDGNAVPAILYGLYLYGAALTTSPDLSMDLHMLAMDAHDNKWGDVALDVVGLAIPAVSAAMIKCGAAGVEGAVRAVKGADRAAAIHHIATNKNMISAARGGPWTPKFAKLFQKAGIDLQHASNRIKILGHKGPHPEAYHTAVYDRLKGAVEGLTGSDYKNALLKELDAIGKEATTSGTTLNKLLTKQK